MVLVGSHLHKLSKAFLGLISLLSGKITIRNGGFLSNPNFLFLNNVSSLLDALTCFDLCLLASLLRSLQAFFVVIDLTLSLPVRNKYIYFNLRCKKILKIL